MATQTDSPWRSIDDVEFATLDWIDWFNRRRLARLRSPFEFEEPYYRAQETPPRWLDSCNSVSGDPGAVQ